MISAEAAAIDEKIKAAETNLKTEHEKLGKIQVENNTVEIELNNLHLSQGKIVQDRRDEAANALLDGSPAYLEPTDFERQRKLLIDKRETYARAILLQKQRIEAARTVYALALREKVFPEYRDCVKEIAAAFVAFSKLLTKERIIRESFIDKGLSFSYIGGHGGVSRIGELHDRNSKVSMWLLEQVRNGYLTADEVANLVGK